MNMKNKTKPCEKCKRSTLREMFDTILGLEQRLDLLTDALRDR